MTDFKYFWTQHQGSPNPGEGTCDFKGKNINLIVIRHFHYFRKMTE